MKTFLIVGGLVCLLLGCSQNPVKTPVSPQYIHVEGHLMQHIEGCFYIIAFDGTAVGLTNMPNGFTWKPNLNWEVVGTDKPIFDWPCGGINISSVMEVDSVKVIY